MEDAVLFHDKDRVRVGGVVRYDIEVGDVPQSAGQRSLYLRVRNTELVALRAAYLNGPFTIYCDMVPMHYSEREHVQDFDEPKYENHVKASSHFSAELKMPPHYKGGRRKWRITIMSEILFSRTAEVKFEVTVGTTRHASKLHGAAADSSLATHGSEWINRLQFEVAKADTSMIWQQPLPRRNEPLHVCVLTHGLVSNVTADMLYVKELVDAAAAKSGENLICKGYTGNVCRTERGVKYLGKRLAHWIVDELIPTYGPAKLSFISHSLGGLIQTYALGYIEATRPEALRNIELVNFVALASPLLGISNENPGYVQFALNFGVVGVTGLDLGLSHLIGVTKPLLEQIPNEHTMAILRRFAHRTLYANAVNDGIVPLRTASLLYLDWRAIATAGAAHDSHKHDRFHRHPEKHSKTEEVNEQELEIKEREAGEGDLSKGPSNGEQTEEDVGGSAGHGSVASRSGSSQGTAGREDDPNHHEAVRQDEPLAQDEGIRQNGVPTNNGTTPSGNAVRPHSTVDGHSDMTTSRSAINRDGDGSVAKDDHSLAASSDASSPTDSSSASTPAKQKPSSASLHSNNSRPGSSRHSLPTSPTSDHGSTRSASPSIKENPLSTFLFGHSKQAKMIRRSQTVNTDDDESDAVGEQLPRKTSLIESGMSLLMPPHPDREFITDPKSRGNIIFHDRVYYQQDLPERRFKSRLRLMKGQKETVEVAKTEERIARSYHSGTSWRKVLVELMPEAHNNIIVRRRFSNAYGWPVVHHLVREHFLVTAPVDEDAEAACRQVGAMDINDSDSQLAEDTRDGSKNDVWQESEGHESEPDLDVDPYRASMLKIIPAEQGSP